jgi:unsaturated chondroitin disaccharide hydrolase
MSDKTGTAMGRWLEDAIDAATERVSAIASQTGDFPHITERGTWRTTRDGVWTGGFWAGLLWLSHERTGQRITREHAMHFTDRLLPRAADNRNHDLGFMFYPSAVKGFEATGNEHYRDSAVAAAGALAAQFNHQGNYIPGWGFFGGAEWSGQVLIDTLMNLPLLVWAARHGGGDSLTQVVQRHAATALRHQLRSDGSVCHMFRFDPATGAPLREDTYQGLSPASSWARGQAWAMTGLAILARMTAVTDYRESSERIATYFRSHLPEDRIPAWDFAATGPREPKDSSAAAIASYGFLKLYQITGNVAHLDTATTLLEALAAHCRNRGDTGGLLLHATADLPHGLGVDESTMYGDYYYLKSLMLRRTLAPRMS